MAEREEGWRVEDEPMKKMKIEDGTSNDGEREEEGGERILIRVYSAMTIMENLKGELMKLKNKDGFLKNKMIETVERSIKAGR